jgi:hypothetical protein
MLRKLICLVSFILVLSMALASGAKAADPNLVGWWLLNEGAGDIAVDASGSGNDGTINNLNGGLGIDGSVWVDDPERGMVMSFNGTAAGAFVRAGDIPQMTLTNDFTWSFWASHSEENTADNDIILGNRMDENTVDFVPRQFIKFTPTKFEWHMNGNGDDNLDYDDIPADVWIHHAVVKTADQLTYYRNGVEASSGTFTQPLDFPQPLYFGGDNEGSEGENWSGLMSDVRIYNRALTELEIVAAMEDVERVDMKIGFAILPPVIDGEVDEIWAGASTQNFVPLDDPANASGSWQVLYDSENLYVIVDMTDDSLQNDSAGAWQDDSIEVYFDGGNNKLDTPLSGDDHQYTFAWATDEIQGTNVDGYTEGIELAQVDTDTGWRIEIKMPWLSLQGAAPQAGDLIGIDCYYNDDDDGGDSRENKLLSFSAIEGWNDASQWGTAVLVADKRVDVTASGDVVKGVPDELRDGSVAGWPDGEYPGLAVDDDVSTKFLHFKGELEPTGIQVEPAFGASVVTGLTFTTANDAPERDPISFELSGSNDSIDGPYTLIASGDIVDFAMEVEWPRFTMNATPIAFENDAAYTYYQIMFPAVRDAASANSMQIAEVELIGVPGELSLLSVIRTNGVSGDRDPVGPYDGASAPLATEDGGLMDGNLVYSDRTYPWAGVPAEYVGSEYIRTYNSDKNGGTIDVTYEVTISRPAIVWITVDDRIPAEWDAGGTIASPQDAADYVTAAFAAPGTFTDTGIDMYVREASDGSNDRPMSVYAAELDAGTYVFGSMDSGKNYYSIGAVE